MDTINNPIPVFTTDLNTKFIDKCHVDWSDCDLISIVSLDGIYILKPQPGEAEGQFTIELIRNPITKFRHRPTCDDWPLFDSIWSSLDHRQYMEVFLDPALLTNVEKLSLDLYPRRFLMTKWSPHVSCIEKNLDTKCLLATITIDHQLVVFTHKYDAWLVQDNISVEYDKVWSRNQPLRNPNAKIMFETIRENLHSLSFCNICWKISILGAPLLLAATIPGDIVIWRYVFDQTGGDGAKSHRVEVAKILETGLKYITSMCLLDDLLIVAARDGQIQLYNLTDLFPQLEMNLATDQQVNGSPGISNRFLLQARFTLWHTDDIEVTDFYIQPINEIEYRIVLAKSTNICWGTITYARETDTQPFRLEISDSFSAIDGQHPDICLHQTPATSLKPAGDRRAVFIADDGSIFKLNFDDEQQDSTPSFEAIKTGRVDLNRMVPRGLCTSPKGDAVIIISSISLVYEPCKIPAPTKVLLLPLS